MIRSVLSRPVVNLISLLIFNIFLLSVQLRTRSGQSLLKGWTLTLISPVISSSSYLCHQTLRVWDDYVSLVGTRKQNRRLQQEIQQLRVDLQRLQELNRLYLRMESYQKFQSQFQYQTVGARVVGKSPPFWKSTFFLNIGSNDTVRADDAVITPLGIVGRILSVAARTSEVELITNMGAAAGVLVGESRIQGIAQGNGNETLSIRYVSSQEQVHAGDLALTSGTDRIYPPGLPVGRVITAYNTTQISKEITLKPAVNLANVQEVLVLTDYRYRQ
ncbi:MAG: rod shape-determining protein MreC [Acidobacteria bacterium]|nr:rod shape-determining protein MreC [Acidobacteriota bacterium]